MHLGRRVKFMNHPLKKGREALQRWKLFKCINPALVLLLLVLR
jgi:hypothetical protein